jgi:uncharacterized delta-60 repeat protein
MLLPFFKARRSQAGLERQRRRGRYPRLARYQPQLEALEDRTLPTADLLTGIGALGDSLTFEYLGVASLASAKNWVEQLAEFRDINFGAFNADWGAPRGVGYEYNWGVGAATTTNVIANGLHTSLAAQVAAGQVSLAVIGGANADLANAPGQGFARYQAIYNGTLTGTALTGLIDEVATNIATIVDTVASAGDVRLVLWNVADLNATPLVARLGFTDPVGRQRYSDAVAALNVRIEGLAAQRGIPVVDLFTYSRQIIGGASWVVGGVPLDMTNYVNFQSNPTHLFEDDAHPGTIGSGLLANAVITAIDRAYGADIAPFSDQELLAHAGLTPPTQGPTYFDVSPFVNIYGPPPGTLDPTFGVNGMATTDFNRSEDWAYWGIAVQPNDGKIIVAGHAYSETTGFDFAVARYNPDGSLDDGSPNDSTPSDAFGTDPARPGRVIIDFGSSEDYGYGVTIDPEGRILVVGPTYDGATGRYVVALARLTANGALDTTFDLSGDNFDPGLVTVGFGDVNANPTRWNYRALLQGDNIVVSAPVEGGHGLVRLNDDGSVDNSFGTQGNGRVLIPVGGWYGATDAVMQADGKVVIADEEGRVFRLDADGSPDITFVPQVLDFSVYFVTLDTQGNVLVGGRNQDSFGQDLIVARLNGQNGSPDLSFGTGGEVRIDFDTDHENVHSIAAQADGRILVIGPTWQEPSENVYFAMARLTANGELDPSFASEGRILIDRNDFLYDLANLAVQPDGGILIPGTVYRPDTSYDFALARLIGITDTDDDGIDDFVDSQPTTFSNDFSDGTTAGSIVSRGDQLLTVVNALDPTQGVVITASFTGGSIPAVISVDNGASTLTLSAGDQVTVTHGSVVRVLAGTVGATFVADSGAVIAVNLASGNTLTFEPGTATFHAPATNTQSIEIIWNGTVVTLDPGETITLEVQPSRIQGLVWVDFNNDGEVNFGEKAIEGVLLTLTGTDDLGRQVSRTMSTDAQGIYEFLDLRPGNYNLTETQPSGFVDGRESLGTVNGLPSGDATIDDQFRDVVFPAPGSDGVNYNFGERPPAGSSVNGGQTAAIGFWQNKNGQNLIKTLNGGPTSTQLGNWLAATFPNMYGAEAGANNLTGKSNADVAAFFTSLFKRTAQTSPGGPPKVDAQVLATALAVYVTNQNLAGTTAAAYGFQVTASGVGAATFNVGTNGAAFGVADNTTLTVLDLLLATDARTRNGLLYDFDGSGTISAEERALREKANQVYTTINELGGL